MAERPTTMTPGVQSTIPYFVMLAALSRFQRKDWGEACDDDKASNDEQIKAEPYEHKYAMGIYSDGDKVFWIILSGWHHDGSVA